MKLLLATTNPGKLREMRALLLGVPFEVVTLLDLPPVPAPAETGSTFAENARAKALAYAGGTGLATVAEDSGLEVDALGGAPGIHSARFAARRAQAASDAEQFALIYRLLSEKGLETSGARFVCALALARPADVLFETCGTVEGLIAPEPRGKGGFGYDPVFFFPMYGRTLAEVTAQEKAAVSHRGCAFRKLREDPGSAEARRWAEAVPQAAAPL